MDLFGLLGLIYIIVLALSLVSVVIILVLEWQKTISFSKENLLLLLLTVITMAVSWSYFIIDFYSIILDIEQIPTIFRVLDVWFTLALPFVWFILVAEKLLGLINKLIKIIFIAICMGCMITEFINYGLLLNGYYEFKSWQSENFLFTTEDLIAVIITVICIVIISYVIRMKRNLTIEKIEYHFIITGTLLVLLDVVQTFSADFAAATREAYIVPIVKAAFAILLAWYVLKALLFSQYLKNPQEIMSSDQILELIAAECSLTPQELVVAKLLYSGSTYKDIGEYLFISVHTVRRHASSIYSKINVSSKMELIRLVREKTEELSGIDKRGKLS